MVEQAAKRLPLLRSEALPVGLTPTEAVALQRRLAGLVLTKGRPRIEHVAGVDCGFDAAEGLCHAAAVIWSIADGTVIEARSVSVPCDFPYVPGLLSFRELPAILAALAALQGSFDAVMCDGHGIAHPRRLGIASHLGLIIDMPTVGCAKSRLVGEHDEPGPNRGDRAPLLHHGKCLGAVLRTRTRVRPVYVSVGHRIDLESAVALVLACHEGYRLPGPTRRADALVAAYGRAHRLPQAGAPISSGERRAARARRAPDRHNPPGARDRPRSATAPE